MNKEYVLFHLREARSELESTIRDLELEPDYGYGEFVVAVTHLYHHVNSAWNARDASDSDAQRCSEADFLRWRQFPLDLDLSG